MVKAIGYVRQSTLKQQSLATQKSPIFEMPIHNHIYYDLQILTNIESFTSSS